MLNTQSLRLTRIDTTPMSDLNDFLKVHAVLIHCFGFLNLICRANICMQNVSHMDMTQLEVFMLR